MKEVKLPPVITVIGSIFLVIVVLAGIVCLRAWNDPLDDSFGPHKVRAEIRVTQPPETSTTAARGTRIAKPAQPESPGREQFVAHLCASGDEQVGRTVTYDPAYVRLSYPGGDVPADRGVCSDVIIRAYRKAGIDLQKAVHEDMAAHFAAYPKVKGMTRPDANIDHRRVSNLMTFFTRKGAALALTRNAADYQPGDVVAWDLGNGRTHVGLVVDERGADGRYLIVHNIGAGTKVEDVLFQWKVIGHYRYAG